MGEPREVPHQLKPKSKKKKRKRKARQPLPEECLEETTLMVRDLTLTRTRILHNFVVSRKKRNCCLHGTSLSREHCLEHGDNNVEMAFLIFWNFFWEKKKKKKKKK